ncbi:signal peptidase I [Arthrobacter sp. PGP41]|uniref:signal peptidase I n=1 Tax=Arthrobacter sp. PGP41 TaxID=2079227 RepID=UPI001F2CC7B6|nr:signal peptidase I [Arthrobacter sp. PGP41]
MALAVLAALVLIVVPRLSGSYTYTVLTSSMAPAYSPGTFLVVRPVPFGELRVGDVITYQIESGRPDVITHRIVAVSSNQQGERTFITKGDNNSVEDRKPVLEVQVRGKLFYAVPHAGFLATAAASSGRNDMLPFIGLGLVGYGVFTTVRGIHTRTKRHAVIPHSVPEEGSVPLQAPNP